MKNLKISKPDAGEYADYYERYVSIVREDCVLTALQNQIQTTETLLSNIPEKKGLYRYAEDKWSIKELVGHIIDTERVMAYRALRFARNDLAPLEGFEQDFYIENADFDSRSLKDLSKEFAHVRVSNIYMFRSFSETALTNTGIASGNPVSVRALAYIIAGHETHHINILKERYLN